jgi:hypothetical protein
MIHKIIDNWYDDPDEIRNLALERFKIESTNGNSDQNGGFPGFYPGFRCKTTVDNAVLNLKKFQAHLSNRIKETSWICKSSVDCEDLSLFEMDMLAMKPKLKEHNLHIDFHSRSSNCSFQYIPEGTTSWIHSDQGSEWAAVIYLHPDPPKGTGTSFHKRKKTGKSYISTEILNNGTLEESNFEFLSPEESLNEDSWEEIDYVENVYNRCIIYEGKYFHTASKFFGTTAENSRLTQVFFFDFIDPNFVFQVQI